VLVVTSIVRTVPLVVMSACASTSCAPAIPLRGA
jgi:hypothetical protein